MKMELVLHIGGIEVRLDEKDAKDLYGKLHEMYGKDAAPVVVKEPWVYPWPCRRDWWEGPIVWSASGSSVAYEEARS